MTEPAFPDPASANVLEPGCARCPALVEARERISWGNGGLDADVMVVGEAPGTGTPAADRWRGGNWTGLAYTARHSGRIVRSMFETLGYGPTELYVTNAVKCLPSDGEGGNREPTATELDTCFAHLRAEIEAIAPTVVVSTGRHATQVVFDHEGIELSSFLDAVLEPVVCQSLRTTALPILHPAYQHVWRSRLGYDHEAYVEAVGSALSSILDAGSGGRLGDDGSD